MEDHQDELNDIFAPKAVDEEKVVFEEPQDTAPTPTSTNSDGFTTVTGAGRSGATNAGTTSSRT